MSSTTESATKTVVHSFPVTSVLGIAFVVLKLCGVINWSWWWVTCPFWGPWALLLGIIAAVIGVGLLAMLVVALFAWFARRKMKNIKFK